MKGLKISFYHEGIHYDVRITPLGHDSRPTVFQVFDANNFFLGQLIYYKANGTWAFHNNPGITEILAKQVIENFRVDL